MFASYRIIIRNNALDNFFFSVISSKLLTIHYGDYVNYLGRVKHAFSSSIIYKTLHSIQLWFDISRCVCSFRSRKTKQIIKQNASPLHITHFLLFFDRLCISMDFWILCMNWDSVTTLASPPNEGRVRPRVLLGELSLWKCITNIFVKNRLYRVIINNTVKLIR